MNLSQPIDFMLYWYMLLDKQCKFLLELQITADVPATPLCNKQHTALDSSKDDEKKKAPQVTKKSKREKFEKLEALSQRLRLCFMKRVNHRRYSSS